MNVLIIEDEPNGAALLKEELRRIDGSITIAGVLPSVAESVQFLENGPAIDLILMDIQLSDGLCFDILKKTPLTTPIIFTTAFDGYLIRAFEHNSLDYLLKPIQSERLAQALAKFKKVETHYRTKNLMNLVEQLDSKKQNRIVIKKGLDFQTIALNEVVYFFVEHKIVFCVDVTNRKYMTEWSNLSEAYAELEPTLFYRANRKYIVNAAHIKSFRYIEFGKTSLDLAVNPAEELIVSQENSMHFRSWIRGKKTLS